MVFHRSLVDWRGYFSQQICQVWCSGIQGISAQVRGSTCHRSMLHHYTFPLPIGHRCMLHCYLPKYLCIMLYVKLMSCSGLLCIYGQMEEGGQSVMKLIRCSGLPWICGQLEEGWGQSVLKIMQCHGLSGIHVQLTGGSISVVVCHVSVVHWRRGFSLSVMKIRQCNGLPDIHAQLRGVYLISLCTSSDKLTYLDTSSENLT